MPETCGRRLCCEKATNLIEVAPSYGSDRAVKARYLLCERHANDYSPEGAAVFLDRATSARLRRQCVPMLAAIGSAGGRDA